MNANPPLDRGFAERTNWPLRPNRLAKLADTWRARGGLLDLTQSNPTVCGFEYGADVLAALAQPAALLYDPQPRGLPVARAAVETYYASRGIAIGSDQMLLTAGTSEAYTHLFRLLCGPGDEVLAPEPSYPLFDLLAGLADIHLRPYPSFYDHGWHLDWSALEAAISPRTRAVLLVHPNNPTGAYCTAADWQRLQALAARRGLAVIVDEVFFDYPGEAAAVSLDYPSSPALTFVLNGVSKLAALPQMKLAWMAVCGPPSQCVAALARLEIINDTFLSAAAPVQLATPAWLAARTPRQRQIQARIASNRAQLDIQLARSPQVSRLGPQAGWNAILRLPHTRSDEEWAEIILGTTGVLVHPGHFYALPSEAHVVISLLPPLECFENGLNLTLSCVN